MSDGGLFAAPGAAKGGDGHRERMRARLMQGGGDAFLGYELLEYLLGLAQPRIDTKPLAKRLIDDEFGSFGAVIAAEPQALTRVEGLGPAGAAAIKFVGAAVQATLREAIERQPLIAGYQPLIDYLHAAQAHLIHEQVRVLYLNAKNILIRDEVASEGTIAEASVHPREIVRRALELGAAGLILVHNHPSGDPTPSRADIALTAEVKAAAELLRIALHDHVIVGRAGHVSLRAEGLMG